MAMVECKECSALVEDVEATPTPKFDYVCNFFCNGDERYG